MAALRRQIAVSSSEDGFFSSRVVPEKIKHSFRMLHSQKTEREMQKRLSALRASDVWSNNETNQLPRSFSEQIRIHFDNTAMFSELSGLANYPVHVLWLGFKEGECSIQLSTGVPCWVFLPVGIVELGVEDRNPEIDESIV